MVNDQNWGEWSGDVKPLGPGRGGGGDATRMLLVSALGEVGRSPPQDYPPAPPPDSEGASGCPWSTARATAPSPGRPTPGVVKQDKSSGGSVDTTKTGVTEGQNEQWREANRCRQRQTVRYRGLVPTPPPPGSTNRTLSLCRAPPPFLIPPPPLPRDVVANRPTSSELRTARWD